MGVSQLVDRLSASNFKGATYVQALNELAAKGPDARDATPWLVELARRASWDHRFELFQVLIWTSDRRAVSYLTEGLTDGDWRVNLAAARALGRLGGDAKEALPALAQVERTHWLPRARKLAADARARVAIAAPLPQPDPRRADWRWRESLDSPPAECREIRYPSAGWKFPSDLGNYPSPRGVSLQGIPLGLYTTQAVTGGTLVGSAVGEGDGALLWVAGGDKPRLIRGGSVFAIIPLSWGLILVQSLAERSHTVSLLEERSLNGAPWSARPIVELPGSPRALRVLSDNRLAIATASGTIVLARPGHIEKFECDEGRAATQPAQ